MSFITTLKNNFHYFYADTLKYYLPQVVELEANHHKYSFKYLFPEHYSKIQAILNRSFPMLGQTLDEFLHSANNVPSTETLQELQQNGFEILRGSSDHTGLVLGHPDMPGWLIKQNFMCKKEGKTEYRLVKKVNEGNVPFWLFSLSEWPKLLHGRRECQIYNDIANPLRVEIMDRGQRCIEKLGLRHLRVPHEYLFALSNGSPSDPLNRKYVVISERLPLLSKEESFQKFADMAVRDPSKLRTIVESICEFILNTHVADMHLENIRFLQSQNGSPDDIVGIFDGEPSGGLIDVSQMSENVEDHERGRSYDGTDPFESWDYAVFPILGLRKLQNAPEMLRQQGISPEKIEPLKRIFDEVINSVVDKVVKERRWHYTKIFVSILCPPIPIVLMIVAFVQTLFGKIGEAYSACRKQIHRITG